MSRSTNKRLTFGAVLIIVGALFLLDNLNLIPWEIARVIFRWEGFLLLLGSIFLITKPQRPVGFILIAVGAFFLLPDIFGVYYNFHIYWPLILIVIGAFFILRRTSGPSAPSTDKKDMDVLDDVNIFGGGDMVINSDNFQGGKTTAVFGGSNYNLTKAKLASDRVVIDVFALFGGSNFVVPADWNVRVEVSAIFGGFSDKRTPLPSTGEKKELFIKGVVLFGGGEVKSI